MEISIQSHQQQHQSSVIHSEHDSSNDQVNLTEDTVEEEVSTTETPLEIPVSVVNTGGLPKPILKPTLKGSSSGDLISDGNTHDESPVDSKHPATPHKVKC